MSNDLMLFENGLKELSPMFADVLAATMPVERFVRTVVVSCEKNPLLLGANRQSLYNAAMTFAVLGLEVDGVTGQGFLVPFKKVVQPIIGYKGYNTLGARAGLTISGSVVREFDEFDYVEEAAGPRLHFRKNLKQGGRVVGAWARATCNDRPPVVRVLSLDDLLTIKNKSPRGNEPPWADTEGPGWPAMCEKSAKRRLSRDMPLNVFQMAARMEEAHEEQGKHSWINPDRGVIVNGEVIEPDGPAPQLTASQMNGASRLEALRAEAVMAAERGTDAVRAFCRRLDKAEYAALKSHIESLKETAERADRGAREHEN